ncbi:response regulator [Nocardiopsis composta]|uniref:DNA-binding NarL/FixJ family response regulator n=1 Tax=Nocardiopsis composta TaxID=157465 RepID=A0A7W8VE30_9ACTN|nr:response regulator transcription factor [Nocardiopsis composta]MBB5432638.1 DNA-binding NarL/FixJ family response regulator [Nocardiopsis composta]
MIRVLIADDQAATREGLRLLLSGEPDVEVAAEAADGFEAVSQAGVHRPDVVLLDVRMPRMDGLAAIGRLLRLDPSPAIIVLTTFDLDEYLFGALRAGAAGFLLKDGDPDLFVRAIRAAHGGQGLVDAQVTPRLLRRFAQTEPSAAPPELDGLTDREREVLCRLGEGLSNAEIAAALHIALGTVKIHVARILAKLGVQTRVQAAVFTHRHGLVPRDPAGPEETDR